MTARSRTSPAEVKDGPPVLGHGRDLGVASASPPHGRLVRVELFPHEWYRANIDEMRDRQRRFWAWMRFPELEARSDEILDSLESVQAPRLD